MEKTRDFSTIRRPNLKSSGTLLALMVSYAFLFFCIGLGADLATYIYHGSATLAIINAAAIAIIVAVFVLFVLKRVSPDTAMLVMLSSITLAPSLSIIYMALNPVADNSFCILSATGVCFVPVLMARLTSRQHFSIVFIAVSVGSYVFAGIYLRDNLLIYSAPMFLLLLTGAAILSSYTKEMTRRIEREKLEAETEWNKLVRFLDLDKQQIDTLKHDTLTKEDIAKLMSNMTEAVQELILQNAKLVVHDDQSMMKALRQKHPALTSGELELCCMIIRGHSVGDISRMRGVGISTITSTRSRLRQKIALPEGEILKSYLESVVNGNMAE